MRAAGNGGALSAARWLLPMGIAVLVIAAPAARAEIAPLAVGGSGSIFPLRLVSSHAAPRHGRLSTPRRSVGRLAGLSPGAAARADARAFAGLTRSPVWQAPGVAPGQRLVRFVGRHGAVIKGSLGSALLDSSLPLRVGDGIAVEVQLFVELYKQRATKREVPSAGPKGRGVLAAAE
jgi:hypothetical protein